MKKKLTHGAIERRVKQLEREVVRQKRVGEQLRKAEVRLQRLLDASPAVLYTCAPQGNYAVTFVTNNITALLGFEPNEFIDSSEPWTERIHPEDRYGVLDHLSSMSDDGHHTQEYRFQHKDGTYRWVHDEVRLLRDSRGKPVELIGCWLELRESGQIKQEYEQFVSQLKEQVAIGVRALVDTNEQLERQIEERVKMEEELLASQEKYKALVDNSLTGIYIDQGGKIVFANKRFAEIYGYSTDELMGFESWRFVHPDDRVLTDKMRQKRLKGKKVPSQYEARGLTKEGRTIWVLRRNTRIEHGGSPAILGNVVDITKRKMAEQALSERKDQLTAQAVSLKEVNTTLKVLLRRREEDKSEIQEKILSNMKELVLPYIESLKNTRLNPSQRAYIDIVESNIHDIVSPFLGRLSSKYLGLTPRELQVADFIRHGKTSKEIAQMLDISTRAVEFHRENIRRKLGLKHQSANLRTYLLSFE